MNKWRKLRLRRLSIRAYELPPGIGGIRTDGGSIRSFDEVKNSAERSMNIYDALPREVRDSLKER